ncbi:MAG TPA: hypothetical protein VFC16_06745 [Nakamurella sp.]|nr:hypothetical protein [Nakamurella sp.]
MIAVNGNQFPRPGRRVNTGGSGDFGIGEHHVDLDAAQDVRREVGVGDRVDARTGPS